MASFDKSYYDILNKYQSIREKFTLTDDTGKVVGSYDELPAGLQPQQKSNNLPTPEENAAYLKQQADAIRATDPARAASFDKQAAMVPQNAAVAAKGGAVTPSADPKAQVAAAMEYKTPQSTNSAPSQEEQDLFKKLHGSSYNPNSAMDKAKLAQLQTAGKQAGGYKDVEKVRNAAYAQQYSAAAAGTTGVTPGKPGQPAGGNSMLIGGKGIMPSRQVNLNTGQSTEVPGAMPVFKPDPSVTAAKATGVPVGTTPAEFDARRAAQTGTTRPASPAATTSSAAKPASPTTTTKK